MDHLASTRLVALISFLLLSATVSANRHSSCNAPTKTQAGPLRSNQLIMLIGNTGGGFKSDYLSSIYQKAILGLVQDQIEKTSNLDTIINQNPVHVEIYPCPIESYEEALAVGRRFSADAVLWGNARWRDLESEEFHPSVPMSATAKPAPSSNAGTSNNISVQNQRGVVNIFNGSVGSFQQGTAYRSTHGNVIAEIYPNISLIKFTGLNFEPEHAIHYYMNKDPARVNVDELITPFQKGSLLLLFALNASHWLSPTRAARLIDEYYLLSHGKGNQLLGSSKDYSRIYDQITEIFRKDARAQDEVKARIQLLYFLLEKTKTCPQQNFDDIESASAQCTTAEKGAELLAALLGTIERDIPSPECVIRVHMSLKALYVNCKKWAQAIASLESARAVAQSQKNAAIEARITQDLGTTYSDRGNLSASLKELRKAVAIWQSLGNSSAQAECYQLLGAVSEKIEPYDSFSYYKNAIDLRIKEHDAHNEALARESLGQLFLRTGRSEKAANEYVLAAESHMKEPVPDTEEAIECYEHARKLARSNGLVQLELRITARLRAIPSKPKDEP